MAKYDKLNKSITQVLNGERDPTNLPGINSIKSSRDRNVLREYLRDSFASGVSLDEFKTQYGIGNAYGGITKNTLKQTKKVQQRAKRNIETISNLEAAARHNANTQVNGSRMGGNPILDLIIAAGYDPDEVDERSLFFALRREKLVNTALLELLEGRYEKTFGWIAAWIADNIDRFLIAGKQYEGPYDASNFSFQGPIDDGLIYQAINEVDVDLSDVDIPALRSDINNDVKQAGIPERDNKQELFMWVHNWIFTNIEAYIDEDPDDNYFDYNKLS